LLSNAVKYSPDGWPHIHFRQEDRQTSDYQISDADQGIVIHPKDKDSLFTTFHRIHRPETMGIRGSGLGLYIAREWIAAMGGEIWLESELNKGSTFFIAIPIKKAGNNDEKGLDG
jgi:signal transduction histidine kinase